MNNLGQVAFDQGDYHRAQEQFQASLRLSQELENKAELASALRHLGHVAGVLGADSEAWRYYQSALEIVAKTGATPVTLDIFLGCALLLSRNPLAANHKQAVELLNLVQHHPAAAYETKAKARQRLLELAAEGPADVVIAAKIREQSFDWPATTNRLIKELSNLT